MRYSLSNYSITAAAKGWGSGWPACTARAQTAVVTAPISGVRLVVHKRIARLVYLLVAETERRGYLLRPGQCWGGNCRPIAGTQTPSNHSWWLAVDLNSLANAYVAKRDGKPVTDMPAWMPLLWAAFGFAWGGNYSGVRADAMHYEFMGSPEDADEMTALAEQRLGATEEDYDVSAVEAKLDELISRVGGLQYMHIPVGGWHGEAGAVIGRLGSLQALLAQVLAIVGKASDVDEKALAQLLRDELAPILGEQLVAALVAELAGDEDLGLTDAQVQAAAERGVRAVLGSLDAAPAPAT